MKLIFICSAYRGNKDLNVRRAIGFCRFAKLQGHAFFAPHVQNTEVFDDDFPDDRKAGIMCGLEVLTRCDELWCFGKKLTDGMKIELQTAIKNKIPIRFFRLVGGEIKEHEEENSSVATWG